MNMESHGTSIPSNSIFDPMDGDSEEILENLPEYWKNAPHSRLKDGSSECITRKASPEEIAAELARLGIK